MSTTRDNDTQTTTQRPAQPLVPDGKSDLPMTLPSYPPPTSDPGGDSGPKTTK